MATSNLTLRTGISGKFREISPSHNHLPENVFPHLGCYSWCVLQNVNEGCCTKNFTAGCCLHHEPWRFNGFCTYIDPVFNQLNVGKWTNVLTKKLGQLENQWIPRRLKNGCPFIEMNCIVSTLLQGFGIPPRSQGIFSYNDPIKINENHVGKYTTHWSYGPGRNSEFLFGQKMSDENSAGGE